MKRAFRAIFISFILLSSFAARVAVGPLEDATVAMERRATALRLLRPLSDQGNTDVQLRLGVLYFVGQGVPQDFAEAERWFRKAGMPLPLALRCEQWS
jgi:TPR repeat protein